MEQRPGGGGQLRVGGAALQGQGQQLPLLPPGVRILRPRLQQPVHALPYMSGRRLHSFKQVEKYLEKTMYYWLSAKQTYIS